MPLNGSGVYLPPGADFPAVSGTVIESSKYNNVVTDQSSAISTAIMKDGQSTITADIPFAGRKITGLGDGVSGTDAANLDVVQDLIDAAAPGIVSDAQEFTQSGTGAVLRTTQDKLRETQVSITDFDTAAGTGTAATDQAALVEAITTLPAAGGEIHFPVTTTSVYTLTSKPSVGSKRIVFVYHGNVKVSPTAYLPDGTHVSGFRQVAADLETDFSAVLVTGDSVDQVAIGGSKVNGFKAEQQFGGSSATGGRHAMYGRLIQNTATNAGNTDRNYVGIQAHTIAVVGDGGASMASPKGGYFGMGSIVQIQGTANNVLNATGGEFNTYLQTGCTVVYKSGLQIASLDEVQGDTYDTLLALSRGSGLGNKTAILMGDMNGLAPCATTGTLIATTGTATVDKGIDFRNYTFSTAILKTDTISLSASLLQINATSAGIELGSTSSSSTVTIDSHSGGSNVDYDVRLAFTGGTGSAGNGSLTILGASVSIPANLNFYALPSDFANDAAAAAGGIAVGQVYRNGSVLQVRVT